MTRQYLLGMKENSSWVHAVRRLVAVLLLILVLHLCNVSKTWITKACSASLWLQSMTWLYWNFHQRQNWWCSASRSSQYSCWGTELLASVMATSNIICELGVKTFLLLGVILKCSLCQGVCLQLSMQPWPVVSLCLRVAMYPKNRFLPGLSYILYLSFRPLPEQVLVWSIAVM